MKRHVLTLCTFALVFGLFSSTFAQEAKADDKKVDNRIWSMQYWKLKAAEGLVDVAPRVQVPPARYTGSEINALTVAIDDGPDVAIIDATNTTQSETSVFVNPLDPNKVLNSNNSTDLPVTQVFGASGFTTSDAGATWTGSVQGTGGPNGGDPAVAINLQGRFHNGYIADNGGNGAAWSSDEGQTWVDVQVAPNPGSLADKNHLWVDNSPTSAHAGNVYASYTAFGGANDGNVVIHRSTDGGLTWDTGQNISNNLQGFHQGVHIQTNSAGVVYAFYTVYLTGGVQDEPAVGMTRSFDGGATWDTAQIIFQDIRGIRSSGTSKNMRVNAFPVSAIDISGGANDGNIYIVWSNIGEPPSNAGPDINVLMRKSTDGGDTWSSHVRVNTDDPADGNENYLPWITCDPESGALSVVFYSDRNVSSTEVEAFASNSINGGDTWEDFKIGDFAFTPTPIPGLAGGYMGDYLAISARGGKVYPVWADLRSGNVLAYTSPYVLADPLDPNAPSAVTSYSDFNTPTSIELNWDDPTSLVDGTPILPGNFTIEISRDGTPLTSVAGNVETYTDTGLNDGQTYTYGLVTKLVVNDSTSLETSTTWTAGGAATPNAPTSFGVGTEGNDLKFTWNNPSTNVDGTPMDDFGGINLYENGNFVTAFVRTTADTGAADSALYTPPSGTNEYFITAFDAEFPSNESSGSNTGFTPIGIPFSDNFESGVIIDGFWVNDNAAVTESSVNPPSGTFALTLDGNIGGDTVTLLPVELAGGAGQGYILNFFVQPQGQLNAPETGDVFIVDFLNDQGTWVEVLNLPGTTVVPFEQQTIGLDGAPNGGGSYFYNGFRFRFRTSSTPTGDFDHWFVDDVFLGIPNNDPTMAVSPAALGDTVLVGGSVDLTLTVANSSSLPSTLNYSAPNPIASWITLSQTSGTVANGNQDDITVSLNSTGLTPGTYNTDIVVTGDDPNNPSVTVPVEFVVNDAPGIAVSPDSLFAELPVDSTDTQVLTISNTGNGPLNFTIDFEATDKRKRARKAKGSLPKDFAMKRLVNAPADDATQGDGKYETQELPVNYQPTFHADKSQTPELMFYKFNEAGQTSTQNFARAGTRVNEFADVLGVLSMGGSGAQGAGLVGASGTGASDFVDTQWATDLQGDWAISFWISGLGGTFSYLWGDNTAGSFRCFTAGAAGVGNLLVRGGFSDVLISGLDQVGPNEVLVVYDSSVPEIRAFLNGDLNNTVAQTPTPISGTGPFKIGAYSTSAGLQTGGIMDDFRFYSSIPSGVDFISADTLAGTVPPGGSVDIDITFNSTGLLGGDYNADIIVLSNDPLNPEVRSAAKLTVLADGMITASPDPVSFPDPIFIGLTDDQTLTVENVGNGPIDVTDITSSNGVFTLSATSFTVPPFSSQDVTVTFTPTTAQVENGTLTIVSNDPSNPNLSVAVTGEGVNPPVAVVAPTDVNETLAFGDSTDVAVTIENTGGAPLDWSAALAFGKTSGVKTKPTSATAEYDPTPNLEGLGDENDIIYGFGDLIVEYDLDPLTGSQSHLGVEYAANHFWVTASQAGSPPNWLYKIDDGGAVVDSFSQPTTSWGWRDMAFDGTYIYGSVSPAVEQIDPATGQPTGVTISGPENPNRALAYDPATDHFWTVNFGGSLYEFDRSGTVINTFPNPVSSYGAAWDDVTPGGPWIWLHTGTATGDTHTMVRVNPTTGLVDGPSIVGTTGNIAGGLDLAKDFSLAPGQAVLVALGQTFSLSVWDLDVATTPPFAKLVGNTSGTVNPGDVDGVTLRLIGSIADTTVTANLNFATNDPANASIDVPVSLTIGDSMITGIGDLDRIPTTFAVEQNYPNPFNPTTTIQYDVPQISDVSLVIYNTLGQKVRTLVNESQNVGVYQAVWDGLNDTGDRVSSGVYIYRFEAGNFSKIRKMVLLK